MKAAAVNKLDPRAPLIDNAARILRVRLAELRSFIPEALDRANETQQHDLRIAAKRLRYVLELTEFCFGAEAERARRRAREIQDVLGDLHDCDVMTPRIAEHAERVGDPDLHSGLSVLAERVRVRRELLFDRFVELWGELEAERTWDRFEAAIEASLSAARERREG